MATITGTRQCQLEFSWLPSAGYDEPPAGGKIGGAKRIGRVSGQPCRVRKKKGNVGGAEGTQASHSFDRVKAIADGRAFGEMPPDFYGPGLAGACPTDALPGSEEKIVVLTGRAARRQTLFHPRDAVPETV